MIVNRGKTLELARLAPYAFIHFDSTAICQRTRVLESSKQYGTVPVSEESDGTQLYSAGTAIGAPVLASF